MNELIGFYHKVRMKCDYCGNTNPNGTTFIIRTQEISGNFCHERHAKNAHNEMTKEKGGSHEENI